MGKDRPFLHLALRKRGNFSPTGQGGWMTIIPDDRTRTLIPRNTRGEEKSTTL